MRRDIGPGPVGDDGASWRIGDVARCMPAASWFSHETAASLWGCWLWPRPDRIHITQVVPSGRRRVPGNPSWHRAALPGRDRDLVGGLPVTGLERTVVDCARSLREESAFLVAESALRRGLDRGALARVLSESAGLRGVRRARTLLARADGRSESAGEALVRWAAWRTGLPAPERRIVVPTAHGTRLVGLGWPRLRMGIELDRRPVGPGAVPPGPTGEVRRDAALAESGWMVARVSWDDLVGDAGPGAIPP